LVRIGTLAHDPSGELILPRLPRRLPAHVLSQAEVGRVLAGPCVATTSGLRDRAILETLYATAMRRTELAHLSLEDLSFDRGVVIVRSGKGRRDRTTPLSIPAAHWLERYLEEARPVLLGSPSSPALFLTDFGEPFCKNRLGDLVKRYMVRAGVSSRGACHLFRHACATHMLENGADVRFIQALLGHADLSTTQIYTHVSILKLKEVHAATHPANLLRLERREAIPRIGPT
jgi:integrase/recombinase XerD